jgi:hypothetical protein
MQRRKAGWAWRLQVVVSCGECALAVRVSVAAARLNIANGLSKHTKTPPRARLPRTPWQLTPSLRRRVPGLAEPACAWERDDALRRVTMRHSPDVGLPHRYRPRVVTWRANGRSVHGQTDNETMHPSAQALVPWGGITYAQCILFFHGEFIYTCARWRCARAPSTRLAHAGVLASSGPPGVSVTSPADGKASAQPGR